MDQRLQELKRQLELNPDDSLLRKRIELIVNRLPDFNCNRCGDKGIVTVRRGACEQHCIYCYSGWVLIARQTGVEVEAVKKSFQLATTRSNN